MKLLLTLLAFVLCTTAMAQRVDCNQNTGNNASIFLVKDGTLAPGDEVRAFSGAGCVGETILPEDQALAYALTVWGDDEISPEVDGLTAGEAILLDVVQRDRVYRAELADGSPFKSALTYSPDALYRIDALMVDSTTTALLDSVRALALALEQQLQDNAAQDSVIIATLTAERDVALANLALSQARADSLQGVVTLQDATIFDLNSQIADLTATANDLADALTASQARADSLQVVIDTFPDVSALEARIASLESEIAATNADLAVLQETLVRIYLIASSQGNKYKDICDALGGC
jgi:uncharacterized coiled-coil protein SlyX